MSRFRWTLQDLKAGTTLVLNSDPEGWKDIVLTLQRSERFHGIFSEFSFNLKFWCREAGKPYIDAAYDADGICSDVLITIEESCNKSFVEIFSGRLNFEKYDRDKVYTTVAIENNSIAQVLLSREDTQVDLNKLESIDGTVLNPYAFAHYGLTLHGKSVKEVAEWCMGTHTCLFVAHPGMPGGQFIIQPFMNLVQDDLKESITSNKICSAIGSTTHNAGLQAIHNTSNEPTAPFPKSYLIEWDFSGEYRDVRQTAANRSYTDVKLIMGISTTPDPADMYDQFVLGAVPGYLSNAQIYTYNFAFNGSTTKTINQGDCIFIYWFGDLTLYDSPGDDNQIQFGTIGNCLLRFTSASKAPAASVNAWAIFESWSRLSEILTNQTQAFNSEFFGRTNSEPVDYADNGCGSFLAITNGLQIRGKNVPTLTTLKDLFDACNSVFNIGLGIENQTTVRVEDKAFFYSNAFLFSLSPKDVHMQFEVSRIANQIEIGYQKWEIDRASGLDEFNANHQYANVCIDRSKNVIEARSPYIAGGYAIELTRWLKGDTNKDWQYDNDMFFICLNRTDDGATPPIPTMLTIAEKDENFASVTGIYDPPTAYNLRISPHRNLLRWLNVLGSSLYKQPGTFWTFEGFEANKAMVSDLQASGCPEDYVGVLIEEQDQQWDDPNAVLNVQLWEPEVYTMSKTINSAQWNLIRANPYGFITFVNDRGETINGWILKIDYKIVTSEAVFTLLKKP